MNSHELDNSHEPDNSPELDNSLELSNSHEPDNSHAPDKADLESLIRLCRRGLKELDLILQSYLDKHYTSASAKEINALKDLLQLDDHSLLAVILKPPKNETMVLASLYNKLRKI